MFTIPLSLIGVGLALFITRTPLSTVVYLGIIMLGGIAVNNGIVLIDFVNVLRKEGKSNYEALVEASKTRLRPILMTSLTTILGLLPLALGFGEGSELQAPLAITVMGGLTSATFLTLVFIPALYLLVVERLEKIPAIAVTEELIPEAEITPQPLPVPIEPTPSVVKVQPPPEIKIPLVPEIKPPIKPAPPVEEEKELNPRQKELLIKLRELKKITRKDYAQIFKVSIPTAARDLKELVDIGLIKGLGPLGPGRWYELI
jgi:HAE1 family hydrophobic/amphiphilic exporter-1